MPRAEDYRPAVVLAVVLTLALTGCTGDDEPDGRPSEPRADRLERPDRSHRPTGTISIPPGSSVYRYVNAGLQAVLDLDADTLRSQTRPT
jgi:hypothetical protein